MRNKGLIITTLIFFLLVNTIYFWEGKLGLIAFPAFLILFVVYIGLVVGFIRQLYFAIREKFKDKQRLIILTILTIVITLTFFKPQGFIDFDRLQGADILVASAEGGGNCTTTLKLKENYRFIERIICFGVTETKGTYRVQNDTIYFENVKLGLYEKEFFKYAVIKRSKFSNDTTVMDLIRYRNLNDTIGHELWITKNEMNKIKNKKPNR